MPKQTQQLVLMLVIGVLIGGALVSLSSKNTSQSEPSKEFTTPTNMTGQPASAVAGTSDIPVLTRADKFTLPPSVPKNVRIGLSVPDQKSGPSVSVEGLSVAKNTWVAIYDGSESKMGWILGAKLIGVADKNATVELLRPEGTKAGDSYYAALLEDDGDSQFNRMTDLPPLSPDKVVIVSFMTN